MFIYICLSTTFIGQDYN